MALFAFKIEDVRRCVEHSKAAPEQMKYWGEEIKEPSLLLVGDRGVYLMSNGTPRDIVEGISSFCAYADGIDPRVNKDWYDAKRDLYGGDDGGDVLPISMFESVLDAAKKFVWIELTATKIKVQA